MLRIIHPDERPELAYRVPRQIDTTRRPHVTAIKRSSESLTGVLGRVTFAFPSGEVKESAVALLAWTRAGEEYLYERRVPRRRCRS